MLFATLWIVLDRSVFFGSLWVVFASFGWLLLVLARFGSFWAIP